MNFMMSMLAHTQSKRLDEQRVCLSSLPGLRMDNPSTTERGKKTGPFHIVKKYTLDLSK